MCTALTFDANSFFFGRNLDLEYSYDYKIVITPRNYPFRFRNGVTMAAHHALIGMAAISEDYPLYFEATNERGLSLAGLNFPKNAKYFPKDQSKINVAPFELIPWVLGKYASVNEFLEYFKHFNIWEENFSEDFPLSPLHWLLADKNRCITLESTKDGLKYYENPMGILTNNPPFDYQMTHLSGFLNITAEYPTNRFSNYTNFIPFSLGMGAMGLPGDPSSPSRFVRGAFVKMNSPKEESDQSLVTQFFHILGSVAQQKGITKTPAGPVEYTQYSSCCNTKTGVYYYTTYENSRISAVNMHLENLNGKCLMEYPPIIKQDIYFQNKKAEG